MPKPGDTWETRAKAIRGPQSLGYPGGEVREQLMRGVNGAADATCNEEEPLFSFGVITDVQYADIPNGASFHGTPRYYRHSLQALQGAVDSWQSGCQLAFCMHLGDIVDGLCPKDQSLAAVQKVLSVFAQLNMPVYHMIGNHCLYNLERPVLNNLLNIPFEEDCRSYYHFSPHPGYRFVVLDGYDISILGWPPEHQHRAEALKILHEKNSNEDKNSPTGLYGYQQRFVQFGGGVSETQLEWLETTLSEADDNSEKVIVSGHMPLHAAPEICLLWNFDKVIAVLAAHPCVIACLAGHAHNGCYDVDGSGIHYATLPAVLECPPGSNAYGRIDVYSNRLSLIGFGEMFSKEMHMQRRAVNVS